MSDPKRLESAKLIDFGLAQKFDKEYKVRYSTEFCGTYIYMAPELLLNKIYSKVII